VFERKRAPVAMTGTGREYIARAGHAAMGLRQETYGH
jgi:hypothetical protein